MDARPTPFDPDGPLGARRAIIRRNPRDAQEVEMVEARWGSDPRFGAGDSYRFVRSEGGGFPDRRCLVPASEFRMAVGARRYRVRLDDGNFFYLAAVWEPPMADWPLSYRILTVPANLDVVRYQDRHGAVILRRQVMHWLDAGVPDGDLLRTSPARTFVVQEIGADAGQLSLGL